MVLDIDDVELIKSEKTSRLRAEKLISIILSKKINVFAHFHEALRYGEYEHLADILREGVTDNQDSVFGEEDDDERPSGR